MFNELLTINTHLYDLFLRITIKVLLILYIVCFVKTKITIHIFV
jgi:hypothetical protein